MKIQVVGCSHHGSSVAVRERLAFNPEQLNEALCGWHKSFPGTEAVLLSTCNRVEFYTAAEEIDQGPSHEQVVEFLAGFHDVPVYEVFDELFERTGDDAIRHLFTVAASLDSMVVGEPQILSQVKQAYELANQQESTGPLTHGAFQAAVRVAKRVATETQIHKRRVSIPSVAVEFAGDIFESLSDKNILVIGAGEMGEETLRYLTDQGATNITVINRSAERAQQLAQQWDGKAEDWSQLDAALIAADLVVSTTGASEPIVTAKHFHEKIEPHRFQRTLLILDLAIPRDFEPAIENARSVYLYSIDDLKAVCQKNRKQRDSELPAALAIVEKESEQFMADLYHRATAPIIKRLREGWHEPKDQELRRLLNKLPELNEESREEISRSFDRLVNKLLHPPLESLRDEARYGPPHGLLDALKRLFNLKD